MGESTLKNADPRLGNVGWAEWTNQQTNEALVQAQLRLLVPVQEMLPFQRQIKTRRMTVGVAQNDQALFEATVPDKESWRLLWMTYRHDDDISHNLRFSVVPSFQDLSTVNPITRQQVRDGEDTPLYPSMGTTGTQNNFFNQRGGPRPEFFPRDQIDVFDQTPVNRVAGTTAILIFRYELIPLPVSTETDEVWTAQSI